MHTPPALQLSLPATPNEGNRSYRCGRGGVVGVVGVVGRVGSSTTPGVFNWRRFARLAGTVVVCTGLCYICACVGHLFCERVQLLGVQCLCASEWVGFFHCPGHYTRVCPTRSTGVDGGASFIGIRGVDSVVGGVSGWVGWWWRCAPARDQVFRLGLAGDGAEQVEVGDDTVLVARWVRKMLRVQQNRHPQLGGGSVCTLEASTNMQTRIMCQHQFVNTGTGSVRRGIQLNGFGKYVIRELVEVFWYPIFFWEKFQ